MQDYDQKCWNSSSGYIYILFGICWGEEGWWYTGRWNVRVGEKDLRVIRKLLPISEDRLIAIASGMTSWVVCKDLALVEGNKFEWRRRTILCDWFNKLLDGGKFWWYRWLYCGLDYKAKWALQRLFVNTVVSKRYFCHLRRIRGQPQEAHPNEIEILVNVCLSQCIVGALLRLRYRRGVWYCLGEGRGY